MPLDFASAASDVVNDATQPDPARAFTPVTDRTNMFQDAALTVAQDSRTSLRSNMIEATKVSPDKYAKDKQVGEVTGIPTPLVNDQVRDLATAQAADQLQQTSPKLANQFQLPDFAHLAHDDIPALSQVEAALQPRKSTLDSLIDAPYAGLQGFAGLSNKGLEAFGMAASTFPMLWDKATGGTAAQDWWFKHAVDPYVQNEHAFEIDKNAGFSEKALNAVGSAFGMLAQAMATGGEGAAVQAGSTVMQGVRQMVEHGASAMMIPAVSEAMTTARHVYENTGDINQAVKAAQMSYATTMLGGVVPLSAQGALLKRLGIGAVSGAATGEGSRVLMNQALPPDMQQPFDPENTVISALMGSVLSLGGGHGRDDAAVHEMLRKTYTDSVKADRSEEVMGVLQKLSAAANESKTRERSPQSFKDFVDTLTEDGNLKNLYIKGDALAGALEQAGISRAEFEQALPEVARQLNESLHTQGDVKIPTSDYATSIAGGKAEALLLPHLKAEPDGMTYADAQNYRKFEQEQLVAQAKEVLSQTYNDKAYRDSADKVEAELKSQLDQANRFTGTVNGAYAKLARAFYETQAAKLGLTPEEMYARYPLNVKAEGLPGDRGFDQNATSLWKRLKTAWDAATTEQRGNLQPPGYEGAGTMLKRGYDAFVESGKPQVFRSNRDDSNMLYQAGALGSRVKAPTPVVRDMLKNLTATERLKVTDNIAQRIVELMQKLPSANEFAAVAHAGRAKRGWYHESARALMGVFGYDAPRFAMLLAAMSPQTSVESNLRNALKTWTNWEKAGRPTDRDAIIKIMGQSVEGNRGESSVLDAWKNNAVRALANEDVHDLVLSGPKVHSFWMNLVGHTQEVTLDTWMANFAAVDQTMFKGTLSGPPKLEPGKGPGYMAFAARVREAAKTLTKLTGEEWTPAEVQETVWSWAKALYEKSASAGEARTPEQIIKDGALSNDLINSTPDFSSLLLNDEYAGVLREAGYGEELGKLAADREANQRQPGEESGDESEAKPFADSSQRRYELAAARRLSALQQDRSFNQSNLGAASDAGAGGMDEGQRVAVESATHAAGGIPSLVGLPARPMKIGDEWYVPGPFAPAHKAAADYMAAAGLPFEPIHTYMRVDVERAQRIAQAYEEMKHDPTNPEVAAAYDALIKETMAQWETIKATGLKVEFIPPNGKDPYAASPREAIRDVVDNNHLWVFPTESGFGANLVNIGLDIPGGGKLDPQAALDALKHAGVLMHSIHQSKTEQTLIAQLGRPLSPDEAHLISLALKQESIAQLSGGVGELHGPKAAEWRPFNPDYFLTLNGKTAKEEGMVLSDNPLLRKVGEKIGDHDMVANDVFRIVHDYFGHIKDGVGFRADGEENAWRSHSSMYSELARRAMTNETRGQNSWVNFGPHGEANRTANSANTVFAPQKIGLMPKWVSEEGRLDPPGTLEQNARGNISFGKNLSEGSFVRLLSSGAKTTPTATTSCAGS